MAKKTKSTEVAVTETPEGVSSQEVALQGDGAVSIESMITLAIKNKLPVDSMERILAMRRELKSEWAKSQFDKAMAAFQAECPTIIKTKEVRIGTGQVAYRYAPIESIVSQVADILQIHGFSYSTSMELKEDGVKVTVKVTHKDGHSEESPMEVPLGNKTNVMSASQQVAAAQTFAKRYAFCNAFGILTGDEDTDATKDTVDVKNTPKTTTAPLRHQPSEKQEIARLCTQLGIEISENTGDLVQEKTGIEFIPANFPKIIKALEEMVIANKQ